MVSTFAMKLEAVQLNYNFVSLIKILIMDIQLEKLELIKMLADTDNPAIIKSVRKILKKEKTDWWDDLTDAQKEDIEEGERQIERGEFVLYEDMMKKHR